MGIQPLMLVLLAIPMESQECMRSGHEEREGGRRRGKERSRGGEKRERSEEEKVEREETGDFDC